VETSKAVVSVLRVGCSLTEVKAQKWKIRYRYWIAFNCWHWGFVCLFGWLWVGFFVLKDVMTVGW